MKWFLININRNIELRKNDLIKKHPGAVSTSAEPRLIWVTMLKRPATSHAKQIFALTSKFNKILEEVVAGDKRSHILKPTIDCDDGNCNYELSGALNPTGVTQFWRNLDVQMHEFDGSKTDLIPCPVST